MYAGVYSRGGGSGSSLDHSPRDFLPVENSYKVGAFTHPDFYLHVWLVKSGLWIRIQLRIRIQAKTELSKTLFFFKFDSNQIKNTGVILFSKSSLCYFIQYLLSGKI
jgi:hypothetical protein